MAMSKEALLKAKMEKQKVGESAFEAGKKPIIDTTPPAETTPQPDTEKEKTSVETPEKSTEPVQDTPKKEKTAKDTPKAKKAATGAQSAPKSLADEYEASLKREEKEANKVKISVTISPDIKEELQKRADKNNKTVSKYLDGLLRGALGL